MENFKKILVGVDLAQGDRLVSDEVTASTVEAVQRGVSLAVANGAEVLFLAVIDVSPQTQHMIEEEEPPAERNVMDDARDTLARLVQQAADHGVRADSAVVFGKPAVEIIRRVITARHDLVVVGTRHVRSLRRALLGSTAVKLVRKCPCPVWATSPSGGTPVGSILVADDLSEVGATALEYGGFLAALRDARLHVLHAVDLPEEHRLWHGTIPVGELQETVDSARKTVESRVSVFKLNKPPQVHVVHQQADLAILETIEQHEIELLVMGTQSRTGISGILLGNTAERLLPEITCSLLAVKPPGFQSPISV